MEMSGQLHLPATLHMGKQARAGLDILKNSYLNKQTFHCHTNFTNELIYQKVNATLMNSTESVTATTVPVITQVFSSRKFMLFMLTWTV